MVEYEMVRRSDEGNESFRLMEYESMSQQAKRENNVFYFLISDFTASENLPASSANALATATVTPTNDLITNSTSKDEFPYYLIGIYSFFAVLFAIGLLMIIASKVKKACCESSEESDFQDYESVPNENDLNPQDNSAFEHHVNVDELDIQRRTLDHDSDYDYCSDEGDADSLKYKPPEYENLPEYENPPEYSAMLRN